MKIPPSTVHDPEFICAILHKLSQPLTAARGALELAMLLGRTPEDLRSAMEESMGHIDRLTRMKNAIYELACDVDPNAEADRISVFAVLLAAVESQRREAEAHGVKLQTSCPDPGHAMVNQRRFRQALASFISGMINYSGRNTTVTVLCANSATHSTIALSNHEGSIPAADLPQMFEAFHSLTIADGECGAAFALGRRVIESAGGSVRAENMSGGGFRFQIRIPLDVSVRRHQSAA